MVDTAIVPERQTVISAHQKSPSGFPWGFNQFYQNGNGSVANLIILELALKLAVFGKLK